MPKSLLASTILLLTISLASTSTYAQQTLPDTRPHVEVLASERMAGRQAGTEGERLAAAYLSEQLTRIGALPLPGLDDFRLPFEFTAGSRDGGSRLTVHREGAAGDAAPRTFGGDVTQVQALSFSDDGEVAGPVVFAGYGIVVPESQNFGYDSYAGLDVEDAIVVVLRYFPEDADQATRAILARYADLRYKAMAARERGARGLIVVTGPRSPNAGETIPMSFDTAIAGSGIHAASVSRTVADTLFEGTRPLTEIQAEFDTGNPHVTGFPLDAIGALRLETRVVRETRTAFNVAGYLPATVPVEGLERPWVAIGAHYDHLGEGRHGSSLAGAEDAGRPHVGADDNASGTAAVLAMAEALSVEPRRRHLLVAFWSAEEIGLLGSTRFVNEAPVPSDRISAYVNFDMVGRMRDNRLVVQATGTSPVWPSLIERVNVAAGFDLVVQPDPYQPTDVATFNQAEVPSLSFTTGGHEDYHRPTDTADRINYPDLDRVAAMATALVRRVMDLPEAPLFTRVEPTTPAGGRAGLRIFTGTIPDYATEVEGLLLGGVVAGGPAERAGLQKGDVIVEIAGQRITNIYDYTYALDLLKVDEGTKVVYLRGGERRETEMVPVVRR
jgi:hypothetical protein